MVGEKHPAKFNKELMSVIHKHVPSGVRLLDPFSGIGTIHQLRPRVQTWGVEIEPEWAKQSKWNIIGDSTALPFDDHSFDYVATSCVYGNRMSDHFEPKDKSRRITYRQYLGRALHSNNAGRMQFGKKYKQLHELVWAQCARVLVPGDVGGRLILNCKNHIRKGQEVDVTGWHQQTLENLGFVHILTEYVPVRGHREGTNHELRVDGEYVILFASPPTR